MPDAKPSDFFLGAIEFFAILLPGAALVYLVQPWTRQLVPDALLPKDAAAAWVVFAVFSYVVGHLLHAITGQFDFIYDKFYLRRFQRNHYRAVELIRRNDLDSLKQDESLTSTLVARAHFQARGTNAGTSLYGGCLWLARLKNSPAAAEVDRLQADSKFFRSLTLVTLIAVMVTVAQRF